MLEALIALTIGAILAFALLDSLCSAMRTMGTSSNEAYAQQITNELVERTRAYGYSRLNNYPGTYTLLLTKSNSGQTGPPIDQRPALLDLVAKQWQAKTQAGAFTQGTVTYTVQQGTVPNSLTVTITVSWTDSAHQSSIRSISRQIIVLNTGS